MAMFKSKSRNEAVELLYKILETQPDVIKAPNPVNAGVEAANFCAQFINAFSNYLDQIKGSEPK